MLVTVEGPDGAGKTTTIDFIVEKLDELCIPNARYHFGPPASRDNKDFKSALFDHQNNLSKSPIHIWDRGFASRWIYTRNYPRTDYDTYNLIRIFPQVHKMYEEKFDVKILLNFREWNDADNATKQPHIFKVDRKKIWELFNDYADCNDGWHFVDAHQPDTAEKVFDIIMSEYLKRRGESDV